MRGPIRDISAALRGLIWPPEPRPISAPVRVRRAIRIRERRAPLSCLVHSPSVAWSIAPPGDAAPRPAPASWRPQATIVTAAAH